MKIVAPILLPLTLCLRVAYARAADSLDSRYRFIERIHLPKILNVVGAVCQEFLHECGSHAIHLLPRTVLRRSFLRRESVLYAPHGGMYARSVILLMAMTFCLQSARLVAEEPVQEYITETWTYDANARTVIYDPGDSLPAQTEVRKRKIIESADGRTITVQDGAGHDLFRRKIVPNTGSITEIQEIYEYSLPTAGWQEVHRTEMNPSAGWISQMDGGRIDSKVIVQTAVPGETKTIIRGPALGLNLDITLGGGLATGVSGKVGQTPVSLAFQHRFGIQTGVTGQIGGRPVGCETGLDWRLSGFTTPTGTWTVSHDANLATPENFSIKQTAAGGRSYEAQWDAIGNLIEQKGSGFLPLQTPTSDTTTGSRTKLNTQVDIDTNQYGLTKAKRYGPNGADGPVNLEEIYTRHPDGSLATFSIGGTISGSVAYGELSWTVTFSDYIRTEQFYRNGPRSSVTANNDGRAFQYDVMQMHKETHTAGPWQGSSVQWGRDDLGRVSDLTISVSGRPTKTIRYGYLPGGELFSITAPYVAGKYAYYPNGDRESVAVNGITQVWRRNAATGFLESVKESNQEIRTYTPDARFRIGGSNGPEGIRAFTYDDANQLKSTTGFDPSFSYAYDGRGNRTSEARAAHDAIAMLDQFKGRTLTERGFILSGKVTPPNANETLTLKAKHPWATIAGDSIPFDAQGRFRFHKSVPLGLAERVDAIVESVHGRPNAPPSLLQKPVSFMLPGSSETMLHDPAGRRSRDAMWQYAWNDAGHLMRMTRVGPFPEPHMTQDVLDFTYDADGRRTGKKRTRKYDNADDRVANQRFLWAGSVMVGEERTGYGAEQANFRWYIWGADISGSTEGAAGIGGLLAIVDETHTGDVARVLHPNYDGMGNVVSLYSDSGQKVVAYDHGPFGEDIGGYGNLAACPFRWQTRYYDAETGLYYFGYRYYDPTVGKWLSRDPIGEAGGLNLYGYCENDPINKRDPLGLSFWDTPLINGGTYPIGDPFYDQATGQWMVTMRKVVALTLGGRMNTASDSVMSLAAAKRLAPHPSYWTKPLPSQPTLLAGTGFQGPSFGEISDYLENHPGFKMQMGIYEGALMAVPAGYGFGLARGIFGARLTGYASTALLGMGLREWAHNDFAVTPRGVGQVIGGIPSGGFLLSAGETHGAAGLRVVGDFFTPAKLTLGGGMRLNPQRAESGAVINPFAELFGDDPIVGLGVRDSVPGMTRPTVHHIGTDKSNGYTPLFEWLFRGASMDLQHPLNKILLPDHVGPHGYYNAIVLRRLETAVVGEMPGSLGFRSKFIGELFRIRSELSDPTNPLRGLLTSPASDAEILLSRP